MPYALFKPLMEMDYLAEEMRAKLKHEFVDGSIHAMANASERNNTIAGDLFAACHAACQGRAYRPFMGDMRLRLEGSNVYYYPDVMVVCNLEETHPMIKSLPCLLAEVTSPRTDGVDRREKLTADLKIPTLRVYLNISQDSLTVDLYQRQDMNQWHTTQLGAEDSFTSVCMGMTLPVKDIYATLVL